MDFSAIFVVLFLSVLGAALGFLFLYWAVRLGVLHALRAHTLSSTSAVSVVSAVPLTIAAETTDA